MYNKLTLLCLDTITHRGRRRSFYLKFGKEICIGRFLDFKAGVDLIMQIRLFHGGF